MADKKSFVMYTSWKCAVAKMTDEQAGQLLKAIYAYQEDPDACPEDAGADLVFGIIKQKLDEDNEKYQKTCEARSDAGKKGMNNRYNKSKDNVAKETDDVTKPNKHNKSYQEITNVTDTESDTESESDTEADTEAEADTESEAKAKEKGARSVPQKKPGHSPAADPSYFPLDDELNEAFKDFLEVRKKQKTPNTPHAVGLLMNQLTKLSADREEQLKIIQQSTMRGWKGLFPLKDEKPRAAPGNVYADLAEDW